VRGGEVKSHFGEFPRGRGKDKKKETTGKKKNVNDTTQLHIGEVLKEKNGGKKGGDAGGK